jgi:uncharacterized protein YjeT (DUF2065 family)
VTRYAAQISSVVGRLQLGGRGAAVVITPAGEQRVVADAITDATGARLLGALDKSLLFDRFEPGTWLATGLPAGAAARADLLSWINARREWLSSQGFQVFCLSDREYGHFAVGAPDTTSGLDFIERVAFDPDPAVDVETARIERIEHQRRRWGRLDLRGFARSEGEDVSFSVGEVYEELALDLVPKVLPMEHLRHRRQGLTGGWLAEGLPADRSAMDGPASGEQSGLDPDLWSETPHRSTWKALGAWMKARGTRHALIVGEPGSGKSFVLRRYATREGVETTLFGVRKPLPLLVPAASLDWSLDVPDLLAIVEHQLLEDGDRAAHVVRRLAVAGRLVVLLDGLDEVTQPRARRQLASALAGFCDGHPRCRVVATSRPTGTVPRWQGRLLRVAPFDEGRIRAFLVRWCGLYESQRDPGPDARRRGEAQGADLAAEVIAHEHVRAIATSPLLLTILAIVQRGGLKLPDHRAELYHHASQVLVERWNRVRSLTGRSGRTPLRLTDAARLLGPVALRVIDEGRKSSILRETLVAMFQATLTSSPLTAITSADELVDVFRDEVGLLVETAPGAFSFLHFTFAEYFAAWEVVRTEAIEKIAGSARAFDPEWREVVLLAFAELGLVRGDDRRLSRLVKAVVAEAARMRKSPGFAANLLWTLLAEDPALPADAAEALAGEVIGSAISSRGNDAIPWLYSLPAAVRAIHGRHNIALRRSAQVTLAEAAVSPDAPLAEPGSFGDFVLAGLDLARRETPPPGSPLPTARPRTARTP